MIQIKTNMTNKQKNIQKKIYVPAPLAVSETTKDIIIAHLSFRHIKTTRRFLKLATIICKKNVRENEKPQLEKIDEKMRLYKK
jgi:hypothetical protein